MLLESKELVKKPDNLLYEYIALLPEGLMPWLTLMVSSVMFRRKY